MKKIIFNPTSKISEVLEISPRPAKEFIPEWYSSCPSFVEKKITFDAQGFPEKTVKMCAPFYDALTGGYIQATWQDIMIEKTGGESFRYIYPSKPDIVSSRDASTKINIPTDFYNKELVWHPPFFPRLPEGYSAIFMHPLNRIDLPFYSFSAIVDCDSLYHSVEKANYPLLIKKGFSGIIPAGTPMYQIFPFKRDDWKSEFAKFNEEEQAKNIFPLYKKLWGGYKKAYWKRKKYE